MSPSRKPEEQVLPGDQASPRAPSVQESEKKFRLLVMQVPVGSQLVSPGYIITANMETSPILIRGDREKIMQVLTNLMINAVKYSPDNKQVEITPKKTAEEATVFVKDRGIGIRPAEYEKIFQRFYRADWNNIQVSGFGIGLYISAEIIRMHGGQIGVEMNDDKGSSFYFKLPVAE